MRVLIALDGSEISERAARAVGAWSRSMSMELDLLSIVRPDDIHETTEESASSHFLQPAGTEPGHITVITAGQYGDMNVQIAEPAPRVVESRGQALATARAQRAEYLRESALRYLPNATPTFQVEFSEEPAEAIVKIATDLGVDAIAMATHGRTGIRHALMGSVAEQVMRLSPVPVILIGPAALEARGTAGRAS